MIIPEAVKGKQTTSAATGIKETRGIDITLDSKILVAILDLKDKVEDEDLRPLYQEPGLKTESKQGDVFVVGSPVFVPPRNSHPRRQIRTRKCRISMGRPPFLLRALQSRVRQGPRLSSIRIHKYN